MRIYIRKELVLYNHPPLLTLGGPDCFELTEFGVIDTGKYQAEGQAEADSKEEQEYLPNYREARPLTSAQVTFTVEFCNGVQLLPTVLGLQFLK